LSRLLGWSGLLLLLLVFVLGLGLVLGLVAAQRRWRGQSSWRQRWRLSATSQQKRLRILRCLQPRAVVAI
jgi:hypothetical protein